MYVCVCEGITESQIRDAIRAGASTLDALTRDLRVGARCGSCVCAAQWLLEEVREELGERRIRTPLTLVVSNR